MGEWRLALIEDLCRRVTSGGTPARSHPEYFADGGPGHPWVKSSELRDGRIRRTEEKITDLGLENSAAKLLDPGAVLVAMYGATAGRVGFLLTEAALNQAICALVPDADRADSAFLFYALRAQYETLSSSTAGAAQQNLNAGTIKAFSILVPELRTQRRIAALLRALDDLIELNERRIESLEDLARSLYREWFVHVPPVGWKEVPLSTVARITMGQAPKSEFYNDTGFGLPFHQGVADFGNLLPLHAKFCTAAIRTAEPLDVLCSVRAPVGRLNIADQLLGIGRGLSAIRRTDRAQAFLLLQLRQALGKVDSIGGGTIYKAVGKAELADLPILEPEPELVTAFEQIARPMLDFRIELTRQIRQLEAARGLLLPRLVTGQLDISDIDLGVLTPADPA